MPKHKEMSRKGKKKKVRKLRRKKKRRSNKLNNETPGPGAAQSRRAGEKMK